MHGRRVGLEVTELLLLGIQPPLTTSLFWRLVKAAVLVGHTPVLSQTGWHTEPFDVKRLLLLISALLVSTSPAAIAWEPGDDWRDDQCEFVIDGANRVADVCRGIYGRGEIFLGIYWRDGAEVVGPCNANESWPVEYRGLSRVDAYDWLIEYCNW